MEAQVIRYSDTTPTRWKNGMGVGRFIAAWPPGRAADDSDWQIASAEMSGTLPFSLYPGIDRALCVTGGKLLIESLAREIILSKESEPLSFPGEEEIVGSALGDETMHDFNLLSRRGVVAQSVSRSHISASGTDYAAQGTLILYVQEGVLHASCGATEIDLGAGDTLILHDIAGNCFVRSEAGATCIFGEVRYL